MIRCLGALVVLLAIGSGCSDPADGASDPVPVGLVAELDRTEEKVLEHEELISRCMNERGFEYAAVLPPDWLAERARAEAEALGGNAQVQESAAIAALEKGLASMDAQLDYIESLTPAEYREFDLALMGGIESGPGCFDQTYDAVWGTLPEFVLEDLSDSGPALHGALDNYVSCMRLLGFDVKSTSDIFRFLDEERQRLSGGDGPSSAYAELEEVARAGHRGCMAEHDAAVSAEIERRFDPD